MNEVERKEFYNSMLVEIESGLVEMDMRFDEGDMNHETFFRLIELYTDGVIMRAQIQAKLTLQK